MPIKIDNIPIIIFSVNNSLFNCLCEIPRMVSIPNCCFRTFKNVPIEYKREKNENITITSCAVLAKFIRGSDLESFVHSVTAGDTRIQ